MDLSLQLKSISYPPLRTYHTHHTQSETFPPLLNIWLYNLLAKSCSKFTEYSFLS